MHWLHKHVKYIESCSTAVWYEAVSASEVCSELLGGMCSSCSERALSKEPDKLGSNLS